ncbi:polysaccharide biosynthesis tyrosine autokinase [Streptomyces olivochromogenes]|uniref:polysaccharide biosynthesis tyrosine autokinase n=1 Tax=Streptomyces olivochromogenes TaxID=1963 RepID=UPI001F353B38|nr:polysaccharide biosynthesis tyrosine autokinase [Streptomyces olivochromogenes]MCF3130198.1 polysaccharide biosynthesis tyrosine autokinase [Streptomyces olivochromogenes]
MDLHGFLKAIARHWPVVVVCLVLAIGAALAATGLSTPVYESRTQLFVATRTSEDTAQLNQGQSFSQARVQSYASIVTTRQVTAPVVKKLGLRTTPEELASRITAVAPLNTVLIDITVRDTVPQRAARIANAVAERFSAVVERLETPKRTVLRPGKDDADDAPPVSPVSLGVTQEAVAPTGPVSPRPLLNLAAGVLGGLLLGAGLVALRETLDTTLKTSEALGEFTALPGLGTIPYDRNAPRQPLVSADVRSNRAEAFRKLRTNLQFSQVDDPPRIIVVTSSVPGEGKTNTAVNLALSLAEAGVSTCLVDADLRRPCVAGTFGLVRDAGLTTVLIGRARIEDVMQQAEGRLSVLASGAVPPNPTELLASARMGEVLCELADTYEVVIVDTAPLLPVADTVGLASLAQGALLVVRAAKTSRDQVRTAAESLNRVGVRVLGTVFNMAPVPRGNRYGSYGSYGELPAPRVSDRREEADAAVSGHLAGEK